MLLRNSHELSDTSSTSVVLKTKKIQETALLDLLCLSKEENDTSILLSSPSLSNLPPIINHHGENILFILFMSRLKCWVPQKEIFYCSPKIVKPVTFFIKLPTLTCGSFCHWHHLSLYFFYWSTTKLFISTVTCVWFCLSSQLHFLEIIALGFTWPAWMSLIFRACWSVGDWIFAIDHMIKYGKHLVEGV